MPFASFRLLSTDKVLNHQNYEAYRHSYAIISAFVRKRSNSNKGHGEATIIRIASYVAKHDDKSACKPTSLLAAMVTIGKHA